MDNISGDDLASADNSTNATDLPDATSVIEYKASVTLWKVWIPCVLVMGGFGNIATIIIMQRLKDHNSSQYAILKTLAISDITVLYCGGVREWIRHMYDIDVRNMHDFTCKIHKWILYGACTTSSWVVTCVTVQRTMAVLWPHRMRTVWTVRRTWTVITALVLIAFGCHFHLMLGLQISAENRCDAGPGVYEYFYKHILMLIDMCLSCIFPFVCQLICDIILSSLLFQTSSSSVAVQAISTVQKHDVRKKAASRTTIMVLLLSFTYMFLVAPVYVFYAVWYGNVDTYIQASPEVLAQLKLGSTVTHLMGYTSASINFYLYCLSGAKYRREFMNLISCRTPSTAATVGSAADQRGRKGNTVCLS